MKKMMMIPLAAATVLVAGCASNGLYGGVGAGTGYDDGGYGYYDRDTYTQYGNYDYDRPDPRHGGYYADNYYRTRPPVQGTPPVVERPRLSRPATINIIAAVMTVRPG